MWTHTQKNRQFKYECNETNEQDGAVWYKDQNYGNEFNFIASQIRSYADVKQALKQHFGREVVIVEVFYHGDLFLLHILIKINEFVCYFVLVSIYFRIFFLHLH